MSDWAVLLVVATQVVMMIGLALLIRKYVRSLPSLLTSDGRKAWAFLALMGASFVFTAMACWALWHVRTNEEYTFYLGLAAHAQLFAVIAVFGAQFVKRTIKAGTSGIEISDSSESLQSGDTVTLEKTEAPS